MGGILRRLCDTIAYLPPVVIRGGLDDVLGWLSVLCYIPISYAAIMFRNIIRCC